MVVRTLVVLLSFAFAAFAQTVDWASLNDGQADSAPSFQQAVDSGREVRLPAGRYRLSRTVTVDLDRSGPFSISGGGTATLIMDGPGPALRIVGTHAGTADPNTVKDNVWLRQRTPLVDALEIVGRHEQSIGVQLEGTMQATLTRLTIRKALHGVVLTGRNRNVIIDDVNIYENRGVGVLLEKLNLHQVNITDSHISYNGGGGVVVRESEVRNLQIGSCDIESNMSPDQAPTANVLIDVRKGSVREGAIVGCTLQHNHDSPGSANIRMVGSPEEPLKAGYFSISANALSDVMVNIDLQHVRGVSIVGNSIWKGFEHDLRVVGSSNIVVGPNAFDRNPDYRPADSLNGIVFEGVTDATLSGLHLNGSLAKDGAIVVRNSKRINIDGVTVLDSEGVGVWLDRSEQVRLSDSLIDHAGKDDFTAVRITGGRRIQVRDNLLGGAVEADGEDLDVEGR